jgi:hypothetical protein
MSNEQREYKSILSTYCSLHNKTHCLIIISDEDVTRAHAHDIMDASPETSFAASHYVTMDTDDWPTHWKCTEIEDRGAFPF